MPPSSLWLWELLGYVLRLSVLESSLGLTQSLRSPTENSKYYEIGPPWEGEHF